MIDYVDRLLVHWAQEFSVRDGGLALGYQSGWIQGVGVQVGGSTRARLTARATASKPTPARAGVGRIAERVNQAVERLPEHLEKAIRLKYLERPGLSGAQNARILGVPTSTFHRYIHRAHELLSDDMPTSFVHWSLKHSQAL